MNRKRESNLSTDLQYDHAWNSRKVDIDSVAGKQDAEIWQCLCQEWVTRNRFSQLPCTTHFTPSYSLLPPLHTSQAPRVSTFAYLAPQPYSCAECSLLTFASLNTGRDRREHKFTKATLTVIEEQSSGTRLGWSATTLHLESRAWLSNITTGSDVTWEGSSLDSDCVGCRYLVTGDVPWYRYLQYMEVPVPVGCHLGMMTQLFFWNETLLHTYIPADLCSGFWGGGYFCNPGDSFYGNFSIIWSSWKKFHNFFHNLRPTNFLMDTLSYRETYAPREMKHWSCKTHNKNEISRNVSRSLIHGSRYISPQVCSFV
jgi:hypothetical protein